MVVLNVISHNGVPVHALSTSFDELGGSIGRADHNQLVLPDPERSISRVHARIVFRAGSFLIIGSGSNGITVNGRLVQAGVEQALAPGDQLQIGGYLIGVAGAASLAIDDPFADLLGGATFGLAPPAKPAKPVAAPPPAAKPGQIPQDWDPFAPDDATTDPFGQSKPSDAGAMFKIADAAAGPDSLDALFGLAGQSAGLDPLAGAEKSKPSAYDRVDLGSELNTPMPRAAIAQAGAAIRKPTPSPGLPADAVFSWDEPKSLSGADTSPGLLAGFEADFAPPAATAEKLPAALPKPVAAAQSPQAAGDQTGLLAALLEGLACPDLRVEALTPELMRLIGSMLRESTRGTVELLVARAALKREMRAELTMIVARENNPLKFSPSVEVALQYLLSAPMPGFMAAAPAMRDAFDDLRAHQLGVMAGMQAALDGVLQRFDPRQLEAKLTAKSAISSLLPALRKARLWELFQELFGQLSSEAQDDFAELFGKAFLIAYEAQLDRLANEGGPA